MRLLSLFLRRPARDHLHWINLIQRRQLPRRNLGRDGDGFLLLIDHDVISQRTSNKNQRDDQSKRPFHCSTSYLGAMLTYSWACFVIGRYTQRPSSFAPHPL